ncbi:metallophosphoesterase [Leucothrix sargassi]|nr:metallophosphoesterase [Leucothrix sargassi]
MKITIISDTHLDHEKLGVMSGDVLIHCGDMFDLFEWDSRDFKAMDDWFGKQQFDVILCVGGNHDFDIEKRLEDTPQPFKNATFLCDETYEHNGVKFYGAPWVPELYRHAFFKENDELEVEWEKIPEDTDVLITHTPPIGTLDESSKGRSFGCSYLAMHIDRVKPRLHCFGHIHASSGVLEKHGVTYINASMVNSDHQIIHEPYEFVYE